MRQKALLFAAILGSGLFVLAGQQPAQTSVFTSAQAEAGRKSYENTCGRCHTYSLHGRKGEAHRSFSDNGQRSELQVLGHR